MSAIGFIAIAKLFRIKHWLLIAGAAGVISGLAAGIGFAIGRIEGSAGAKVACAEGKTNELVEGAKKHAKNIQKNSGLDDDVLDRRTCGWVLDMPFDECVARYKSVRSRSSDAGDKDTDRHEQRSGGR